MNLAELSIRRPIFITCLVLLMLVVGWMSFRSLPVDLFPNVQFPIVTVTIPYRGAGPSEIETLVTQPIEEEVSTIAGLKRLSSKSVEGMSQIVAEFGLGVDIQNAEQQIRDKVGAARARLPLEAADPIIRRLDPNDQPVLTFSLQAELGDAALFDLANQLVKPRLEQIRDVGLIEILGGRPREVRVSLDRKSLASRELSVQAVAGALAASGQNVPGGKVAGGGNETIFRSIGEFHTLKDVSSTVINLYNNDNPTRIADVGVVEDSLRDEESRVFVNGRKSLFINVYRQSGANTIAVADGALAAARTIGAELSLQPGQPKIETIRDSSQFIRSNIYDVKETIFIGIILTILVVYFFLSNGRSTIITAMALPNSLVGAFILMAVAGFSVNVVTLLALSLAVGLLIDDAIVVRENIFRHIEAGEEPAEAALIGTSEVQLAVVATTFVVIAVFAPVAFMTGIIGQFLKQFGLTVCFAMAISLFDALTIAPMLSAYFGGSSAEAFEAGQSWWSRTMGPLLRRFDRFEAWLEDRYEVVVRYTLDRPKTVLATSLAVFAVSFGSLYFVPQVFLPDQDSGEFTVELSLQPGADLDAMTKVANDADKIIRAHKEVAISALTIGGRSGEADHASAYIRLVKASDRSMTTTTFKNQLREELLVMKDGDPKVLAFDPIGGASQPIAVNLISNDQPSLERAAQALAVYMRSDARLRDVDTTFRQGKPELQIQPDLKMAQVLGVNTRTFGQEVRAQIEGLTPAKFRENGHEYDIRVRLQGDQRDLRQSFGEVLVPNLNQKLVRLADFAAPMDARGPAEIDRQNRGRTIQVTASLAPKASMATVLKDIEGALHGQLNLPPGMHYTFASDAENFQEMGRSVTIAILLGVIFVFFVLASLYESFITPLTIMLALPLALCGAFFALFITGEPLSLFAILGIIMLLGVASKNSILLVDFARRLMDDGYERSDALVRAGRTRLRPILMTSMALIAGTIPVAVGLNEASRQRTGMGIAIIGGLVSSTILTLIVIPAAFCYIDRFRIWSSARLSILTGVRKRKPVPEGEVGWVQSPEPRR